MVLGLQLSRKAISLAHNVPWRAGELVSQGLETRSLWSPWHEGTHRRDSPPLALSTPWPG